MARLIIATFVFGVTAQLLFHPNALFAADKLKPAATPAPRPNASDRFGAVRGWTLICTLSADDNDFTYKLGVDTFRQNRRGTIVARIDLTDFKQGKSFFEWDGKGSAHFDAFDEKFEDGHGIHSQATNVGGGSKETHARLVIDRIHGTYTFHVAGREVKGTQSVATRYDDPRVEALLKAGRPDYKNPNTYAFSVDVGGMTNYFDVPHELPPDGLVLGGDTPLPVQAYLKQHGPGLDVQTLHYSTPLEGTLTWELVPKGMEILDLEIIPEKAYKQWLPRGDLKEPKTPGNSVKFAASLTAEDGQAVRSKTNQFFFELEKTSSEPGVCMNWPPPGVMPAKSFDLKFPFVANGVFPTEMDGQKAISKPGPLTVVTGEVASYDFGGYGRLKVRAVLDDGRVIYGHLQGDRSRTRILIPYRENESSKVAQKYKDDCHIPGARDSDDEEKPLGGQGQKGDGLCVYEEYRGFVTANGSDDQPEFARLDPLKKNLFVLDERTNKEVNGLSIYTLVSEVETALVPATAHQNRVINFNHSSDVPHLCDQHLIRVRTGAPNLKHSGGEYFRIVPATPASGYYTPADVDAIEDNTAFTLMLLGEPGASERGDAEIEFARQLFRATGGHYHGDGDEAPVQWTMDAKGTFRENGKVIKVLIGKSELESHSLTRNDGLFSFFRIGQRSMDVGKQKGRYSGVQDCIMRSHDATAHVSSSDPSVRYLCVGQAEGRSVNLCTSAIGTGVNAAPHSRYGDATFGACRYRIRVSDVK